MTLSASLLNSESEKLFMPGASICPIYNEKEYVGGDIMYGA